MTTQRFVDQIVLSILGNLGGKAKDPPPSDLETMIKPYREVILRTTTPPPPNQVQIPEWKDLVRASDTLGKPILRRDEPAEPLVTQFYVLDGVVGYVYLHHEPPNGSQVGPGREAPGPGGFAAGAASPIGDPGNRPAPAGQPLASHSSDPTREQLLRDRASVLMARVQHVRDDDPRLEAVLRELRQGIHALRSRRLEEAERSLGAAEESMDRT